MINLLDMKPADFERLYDKHGLRPARFKSDPREGSASGAAGNCCGMGALAVELGLRDRPLHVTVREVLSAHVLDSDEHLHDIDQFMCGFDAGMIGAAENLPALSLDPREPIGAALRLGYETGMLMAKRPY